MAARQQIDELRIWTPLPQGTTEDKSGVDKKLRDFATHTHRISKSRVVLFGLKGAGSFHIHRKTMKELFILAVLGIREQPNLTQNLVTHRH